MADLCGANAKSTGRPCIQPVQVPDTRCRYHGGAAPQVRAAVERRKQLATAVEAVATFGLPRQVDPRDALLEEVWRTAGAVDWLGAQVKALEPDAVVWGRTEEVDKGAGEFTGVDVTHKAAPNIWVDLWQRERKHLIDVCKAAIVAGIEERRVQLAERQGALAAQFVTAVLSELGLAGTPQATAAIRKHLALLPAPVAA